MAPDTCAPVIQRALTALQRQGILGISTETPVNIYIGRAIFLQFLPEGRDPVGVRVGDDASVMERENTVLGEMSALYGDLVPKPLALDRDGDSAVLIMEIIPHQPTTIDEVLLASPAARQRLRRFLIGTERAPLLPGRWNAGESLAHAMSALPENLRGVADGLRVKNGWDDFLGRFQPVPQHSDLAINNFGRIAGEFVIFDWEDYGAVNLPGFDFVVLLASGYQFNASRIGLFFERAARGGNIEAEFSTELLNNLNILNSEWVDFFLVNLILFHGLKLRLDYGQEVTKMTLKLIRDLAKGKGQGGTDRLHR